MSKNKNKTKRGFSLLEVLIAIFIIIVGFSGSVALIVKTIRLSSLSVSRLRAAYLAQEGAELIRNVRDTNWLQIRQGDGVDWDEGLSNHCPGSGFIVDYTYSGQLNPDFPCYSGQFLRIDNNGFYNYSSGQVTKFQRKITINKIDDDTIGVLVEVFWKEHGENYSFSLQENLYNWLP